MASERYQYVTRFVKNYNEDIEKILGREINTENFEIFRKDIEEIMEFLSSASKMRGDESFEKLKKFLDKKNAQFDKKMKNNSDIELKLETVERLYKEFYDSLDDLDKQKTALKDEGFEKELAKIRCEIYRIYKASNYYGMKNSQLESTELQNEVFESIKNGESQNEMVKKMNDYIANKKEKAEEEQEQQSQDEQKKAEENQEQQSQDEQKKAEENQEQQSQDEQDKAEENQEQQSQDEQNKAEEEQEQQSQDEQNKAEEEQEQQSQDEQKKAEENQEQQSQDEQDKAEEEQEQQSQDEQGKSSPDEIIIDDENIIVNGEPISSTNEWDKAYSVINDKIDSIEKNINDVINEYSKKCTKSLTLEEGNIGKNANVVLIFLKDEDKQEFVDRINEELSKTKQIKEEIAAEYIKITEDGIKKLRDLKNDLDLIIENKQKIDADIEEKKVGLEEMLKKLDELKNDISMETDQSKINEKTNEISALENDIELLRKEISDLEISSSNLQKQIEYSKSNFEKSQNEYLEAADSVRKNLETKGINIGLKSQEIEKETEDSKVEQGNQNTTSQVGQGGTINNNVAQQSEVAEKSQVKNSNLPSTNIDPKEKFKNDYNNIINGAQNLDSMLTDKEYENMISSFEGIMNSPYKLTKSERKNIQEIFEKNKGQILNKMEGRYFNTSEIVDTISKVTGLGPNDFDVLRRQLSAEDSNKKSNTGEFLNFEEMDISSQTILKNVINSYSNKVKNGELSEEEIKIFEENIAGPMRFAYLNQCAQVAGKYGGKKFLGIIPTGRKKVDNCLESINTSLKEVDKYLEQSRKINKDEKNANEPVVDSPEVTKEISEAKKEVISQPKSFKEMLGSLINSNDEINLTNELKITSQPEKIKWNSKNLPNNNSSQNKGQVR